MVVLAVGLRDAIAIWGSAKGDRPKVTLAFSPIALLIWLAKQVAKLLKFPI